VDRRETERAIFDKKTRRIKWREGTSRLRKVNVGPDKKEAKNGEQTKRLLKTEEKTEA